ncbi:hypothetical protein RSAG8_09489, partial [Rhizoctonia solani AG-8 WAC10335]
KLELPHHSADPPITFQSLLGGMESPEQGHFGPDSAAMRAGENANAETDSEPLTPTSSAHVASQIALKGVSFHAQQSEEYDKVDQEEAMGEEEEAEIEDGGLTSSSEEDARTENANAETDSEPLTPTSSAHVASQTALKGVSFHAQQREEYDEVDQEEATGEEEEAEVEDGGLTSSSEEDARTETADGLDHLTESIGEPFGLQAQADAPSHMEQSFDSIHAQHGNMLGSGPLYESPRLVSPPPLPEGFDTQFVDHRTAQPPMTPNEMEIFQAYGGEVAMPEEVLVLQPVICDACRAPMAASKWYEHVSRSGHRRNAAHYAQWKFEHLTARYPDVDSRELWAQ